MQHLTERQNATACGTASADVRGGTTYVYPVAGTPSHKKERGVTVSRRAAVNPRPRLSLRARIQWLRWRELPAKARENWITTSIYLLKCRNYGAARSAEKQNSEARDIAGHSTKYKEPPVLGH
jgi:hypothetical protein